MHKIEKRKWKPREGMPFPTLGLLVGSWIQKWLIVPSGMKQGQPFKLYPEQWRWLLHYYRLKPEAEPDWHSDAFTHYGGQLVRSQKWGKDPLAAAQIAAHGLGPVEFGGWDENGEPIGIPNPSPNIQVLATVKDQALNTWQPLVTMLKGTFDKPSPLSGIEGLDAGATRILFPKGMATWNTSVSESRLGAPITFATFTEPHLYTEENKLKETARTVKRNLSGMGGRWVEVTNPWNPMERSTAQTTYESDMPGVLIDYRRPEERIDLSDKQAVYDRLSWQYGDAARTRGGHVSLERQMETIYDPGETEGNVRRYYLGETAVGDKIPINGERWKELAIDGEIQPGARIGLGFDGSRSGDCTALVAYDIDNHIICVLNYWERDPDDPDWTVPRAEVDKAVREAYRDFKVGCFFGDPYFWEDHLDRWAEDLGRVFEYKTNEQRRFDEALVMFQNLVINGTLHHMDQDVLNRHINNAVVKYGGLKPPRNDHDLPEYYQKVGKRKEGHYIDTFIAAVLAVKAGGYAQEKGLFPSGKLKPFIITK